MATPLEGVRRSHHTVDAVTRFTEGGIRDAGKRQGNRTPALDREVVERALGGIQAIVSKRLVEVKLAGVQRNGSGPATCSLERIEG
jgi:hypothetical protein